jgi:hypothetical protein
VLAADALGVGEVALGIAVGYAAFRALRQTPPAGVGPGAGDTVEHG